MLGQAHRFHGYGSLKGVYARGQSFRSSLITVKFTNRGPGKSYRVAVVVSKKVSKSAVMRNRIRRRVYEAVRLSADQLPAGSDLVFTIFSDQVAELQSVKLQAAVNELLVKVAKQSDATPVKRAIVKPVLPQKEEI